MKLTFGKLVAINFLSFNHLEFDYDSLDGMTLVTGKNNDIPGAKNGIGKSNLFKALVYVLFGEFPDRINKLNIPNRTNGENDETLVSIELTIRSSKYRITRGLTKKYRSAYCKVEKIDNDEVINLTKSSLALTQEFINTEILRTDIDLFLRSMLMSADQSYNFFKLSAGQKKEFIENLFGLDFYNNLYTHIHRDCLEIDKTISGYERDLLRLSNAVVDYKNHEQNRKKELKQNRQKEKNEIEELKVSIDKLTKKIKTFTDASTQFDNSIAKVNSSIQTFNTKLNDIKYKELSLKEKNALLVSKLKLEKKLYDENDLIYNALCDECKEKYKTIKNYSSDNFEATKSSLENSINKIKTASGKLGICKDKIGSSLSKLAQKLSDLELKRSDLTIKINDSKTLASTLKEKLNYKENALSEAESNSENPYSSLIRKLQSDISKIEKEITDLETEKNYLKICESIVSQDTIKQYVVRDMLHLLNSRIAYYLNKVGAKYTCEFNHNLDYVFITTTGQTDYNNFSSGERMRLAIATSFAFRDVMATRSGISSNILVLDEYMDMNLDSLAINGILSILKEFLALYGQRIYVISQRQEVDSQLFNNIVFIEKTNNVSTLRIEKTLPTI